MKVFISKNNFIFVWLIIYFTSKILWDYFIPGVFELISLFILLYGAILFILFDKRKKEKIILYYFLFCMYVIINALFQNSLQQFLRALYEYCFYFLMFFSIAYFINKINIQECLTMINKWGLIISLLSWFEYIHKDYILPNNFKITIKNSYGFRAAVFTRSYLSHAMILGFFALVSLYLFYQKKNKCYLLTFILCASSILTTSSRGPLVALVVATFIFYYMNTMRKKNSLNRKIYLLLGTCLAFYGALLFLNSTFTIGNDTVDYFLYRIRQIANWSGDPGNVGRIEIWKLSIEWFKSNIWFGIGPSHTGSWGRESIGVTESGYLKFLCELGICGFGLLFIFLLSIIKKGFKNYKKLTKQQKLTMIFYFSLIVLVMINNITLQSSEEIQVNFIWALGMGGLLNTSRLLYYQK